MKKPILICIGFITIFSFNAFAQQSSIFPKGEIGKNTDDYTGTIWLNELNKPGNIFKFGVAQAVYAPGSKLNWHIHPGGQILLITEGTGYYQEKGKPVQIVHQGDVIKCQPGVEHWHAAAPNSDFAYIAISPSEKGKTIWKGKLTDAAYNSIKAPTTNNNDEETIKELSKKKWLWMADKNVDSLSVLFDDKSMFVHMGGSWGKQPELNTIKSGGIWYKKAVVYSVTVNMFGNTAILLNDIDLVAEVGGREVTNPFMVTEVYIKEDGKWKMAQFTFSHLMRQIKIKDNQQQ